MKRSEDFPDPVGVRSAKQARSQRKHEALLQAGRRLLDAQDLAALSVAQLTRDAGMSVGSFYSRFDDKNAWFGELLRVTGDAVLADTQALLDSARWQRAGDARKVALIVRHIVDVHRQHRGIFRSALSDAARSARFWAPMHLYGRRLADAVHQALQAQMHNVPRRHAAPARGHRLAGDLRHLGQRGAARPRAAGARRPAHRARTDPGLPGDGAPELKRLPRDQPGMRTRSSL